MPRPRALVAFVGPSEGAAASQEVLSASATVRHVPADEAEIEHALQSADALIDASMKVRITDKMVAGAEVLKMISCATTGSDHIETTELVSRGIPLRTLRDDRDLLADLTPAAELTWALLMACARRLPAAVAHVRAGGWTREAFPGVMLNGRTLGLVGCGRLGGWMARYGQAFGMEVVGYDPHLETWPSEIRPMGLDELFESSDFISIHVHLTPETRGLVSRELLERVKPGAILINTSRGAIIDERALLEGLEAGLVGGAGLDVLEGEPDIEHHPLVHYGRTHDNLLITPHCGGFSPDAVRLVCARAASKILPVLS